MTIICKECRLLVEEAKRAQKESGDADNLTDESAVHNKHTKEVDSAWHVMYELANDENWYIFSGCSSHHVGHKLTTDLGEMQAEQNVIPDDYLKDAAFYARSGMLTAEINALLVKRAGEENITVTWTYPSLRAALRASNRVKLNDGAGYADWLTRRNEEMNYPAGYFLNEAMELSRSYLVLENYDTTWASCSRVLLFDPVHGCNQYGHYYSSFSTVDRYGITQMLMYVTLDDLSIASFKWAFAVFIKHFRYPPTAVATDSDNKILAALDEVCQDGWPWSALLVRLLCIFHISKNFYEHLHPLFVNKKREWGRLMNMFWRTGKDSDKRAIPRWRADWTVIVVYFTDNANGSDGDEKREKAIKWLNLLGDRAECFAYRFTWRHFTAGVNSTQRAEAKNSGLRKSVISSHVSLLKMGHASVTYSTGCYTRGRTAEIQLQKRLEKKPVNAIVLLFKKHVTTYAYGKLVENMERTLNYRTVECEECADSYIVQLIDGGRPEYTEAEAPLFSDDGMPDAHEDEIATSYRYDSARGGRLVKIIDRNTNELECSCQASFHLFICACTAARTFAGKIHCTRISLCFNASNYNEHPAPAPRHRVAPISVGHASTN